jgi:hypothetical protein
MVTLLGTCGAFQSVVAKSPDIAFFSGLALAIVAVVDKVVDPTAHAAAFQEDYKRYTRFLRVARSMEPDKIQAELDLLHVDDEPEIEALRQVAYNDTLEECGLDTREKYKLGWSSRLAAAVA